MSSGGAMGGVHDGIVDTLIGLPTDHAALYDTMRRQMLRDAGSQDMLMPAQYMFKDIPLADLADDADPVAVTLAEMDRFGISTGLISLGVSREHAERALREHPERFVASLTIDPNRGMEGIRDLVAAHEQWDVRAVSLMPHGVMPQVAIDAPLMYPIYAKCVELGLPVFITVGVAGPRVPSMVQRVELLDQVMYDFPELVVVMRHGAEPWVDLAVKLMLKWPNLHYSTSAFAPKYYPKAIIDYANSRGADRVLYGGYFPMGLTLERIMSEMVDVAFADHVWPKFLGGNARRVLGLDGPQ
jgi:predicted TIM-barrel fold metal-dependent hydrolase